MQAGEAYLEVARASSCDVIDHHIHHEVHPSVVQGRRQSFQIVRRTKVVILRISCCALSPLRRPLPAARPAGRLLCTIPRHSD